MAMRLSRQYLTSVRQVRSVGAAPLTSTVTTAQMHQSSRRDRPGGKPKAGHVMAQQAAGKANARFLIPEGTTLPHTLSIKGQSLRIENIPTERAEDAWHILQGAVAKGEGYSREELEPLDEFVANSQKTRNYFEVIHEADDDILAVIILMPSPLSRSERSVHFGGPIAVNPKYRGKGLGSSIVFQAYSELGRVVLGHPGFSNGRTVVGKSINAILGTGSVFHGLIPNCSYLEGIGWTHDLTITAVDPRLVSRALAKAPVPELPPLIVSDTVPEALQTRSPRIQTFPTLALNGHTLNVENASDRDVWRVEEMIRQAAQESDGFGIDEFTKDGHFNRKLMFDSQVIVAKTSDDVIVATAVLGASKVCRAYNPSQVGGYMLVNKDFRRKGLGESFFKYLMKQGKDAGYTAILTDTYTSNIPAQQLMNKLDFMITGTFPHCGYVKNKGYLHSHMYWRSL